MLTGNATVSLVQAIGITLGKPAYNPATNTMTQPVVFAKGGYPEVQNLLVLKFEGTRVRTCIRCCFGVTSRGRNGRCSFTAPPAVSSPPPLSLSLCLGVALHCDGMYADVRLTAHSDAACFGEGPT